MDWLTLIRAPRLGNAGALRLLQHCGSAAGCFTSELPASLDLHAEARAYMRAPDLKPIRDLLMVAIDFSNFRFQSKT